MNNAVTTVTAGVPGPSVLAAMADRYSMAPAAFEATLRATVVPKDCTREQFAAFLLVAKQYKLNPLTREIFAFPTRGGGIQPVVSIDGWLNLANSHPQMDGIEFDDQIDGDGEVISVTARIWRKDRAHPIVVTEYMSECARNTEPWKQWPRRMLRHKAAIQAARYAFGFAGFVDPDEAERMGADVSAMRHVTPPPRPPSAPKAPQIEAAADSHDPDTGEMIEDETRAQEPAGAPGAPPAPSHPSEENNAPAAAPSPPPAPLTAADRKALKAFADALASVNTPAAVIKGTQRFWQDAGLGDDDTSPLATAATAIMDAHSARCRAEVSIADTDATVKRILAP